MNIKLIIRHNAAKLTHHSSIVSIIHPIFAINDSNNTLKKK